MVDPPLGWMYGFPKPVPYFYFHEEFNMEEWLIREGYPPELIKQFPKGLPCHFWETTND